MNCGHEMRVRDSKAYIEGRTAEGEALYDSKENECVYNNHVYHIECSFNKS